MILVNFCLYIRHIRLNNFALQYVRMNIPIHCFNKQFTHYNFPQLDIVNNFSISRIALKSKNRGADKKKLRIVDINSDELEEVVNVERMKSQFDKAIEDYKDLLVKNVGIRTNIGAIEELPIKYEGTEYQLRELAEINRQPKLIIVDISAFPQIIPNVLDVICKSKMNLNPQQQGTVLYIPIPKVTKEYRENLAKTAKAYFVKCKDNITDVRNKHIKKVKQEENASSELVFRVETYISNLSREYVSNAEKLLETKQKELLGESQ